MFDLLQRVCDIIDRQFDDQVKYLQDLVQEPSILGNESAERAVQAVNQYKFHEMNLDVTPVIADHSQMVHLPGYSPVEWSFRDRPLGIVGVLKSRNGGGKSFVLNGHVDVVDVTPLRQWKRDPFGAQVEGDRLYGRGAADMKGGVSAIVYATKALQKAGVQLKGDLILQTVLEEEGTGNGSLACLARGFVGDACLIPEPFEQKILTAEVGVLWMRADVFGSAGHTRGASSMVNAIDKAYQLVGAMRQLEQEWNEERHRAFADHPHPLNFNLGLIKGGNWPSSVPAHCEFSMRLSMYPGVDPEDAKRRVQAHIDQFCATDPWLQVNPPEITWYGHHNWGVYEPNPEQNPLMQSIARAHAALTGSPVEYHNSTACTDVRFWTEHWHKASTCYGPSGEQLHAANEWVSLESVRETTKVIAGTVIDWCGVPPFE